MASNLAGSNAFSHLAMTKVATVLPTTLVSAVQVVIRRSTPKRRPSPLSGRARTVCRVRQLDEGAAGEGRTALGRERHDGEHAQRLSEREGRVGRLRDEADGDRHIEAGAVEVEAIAGRQHEADDGPLAPGLFELQHQARQGAPAAPCRRHGPGPTRPNRR